MTPREIEDFRKGMKRLYAIDLHPAINALCDAAKRGLPVQLREDDEGLLPCPLCGGAALGIDHPPHKHFFVLMPDHPGSYTIECVACNLGSIADTKAECVAKWNSRATFVPPDARPLADWHDDHGEVLWWKFPIDEPPYCGSPLCMDWPGYHTHWTPLPPLPVAPSA